MAELEAVQTIWLVDLDAAAKPARKRVTERNRAEESLVHLQRAELL